MSTVLAGWHPALVHGRPRTFAIGTPLLTVRRRDLSSPHPLSRVQAACAEPARPAAVPPSPEPLLCLSVWTARVLTPTDNGPQA